jgi:hypothetical protein
LSGEQAVREKAKRPESKKTIHRFMPFPPFVL